MKELRWGYTTGACAAAGVKAALLFSLGQSCAEVKIISLDKREMLIPIKSIEQNDNVVKVEVVKDSGDDPDITNGATVVTEVRFLPGERWLKILGGAGVGKITKPGLALPVGEYAINPGPRKLIAHAVAEIWGDDNHTGLMVTISVPGGEELARRTLNPSLGIVGGISIIGTTGVLRPMSEDAFKNSLLPQIDVAVAQGRETLIMVPGKIGENIAVSYGLPREAIVQMSNFVGFMLEGAAERGVKRVLLCGHLGKLSKVAAGVFHTHNRMADARMETLAAHGAALGLPAPQVRQMLNCVTTEEALGVISDENLKKSLCAAIAAKASERAEKYVFGRLKVGTMLVTLKGELLAFDAKAGEMGRDLGWIL